MYISAKTMKSNFVFREGQFSDKEVSSCLFYFHNMKSLKYYNTYKCTYSSSVIKYRIKWYARQL